MSGWCEGEVMCRLRRSVAGGGALFLAVLWGLCTDANAAQVFVSPQIGRAHV